MLPYAPVSLLFLLGFWRPGARVLTTLLTLVLIPYLGISFVLIHDWNWHGVYLLPLTYLMALFAGRAFSPRSLWVAALLALTIGIVQVRMNDHPEKSREYVRGLEQLEQVKPLSLFTVDEDLIALFSRATPTHQFYLPELGTLPAALAPEALPKLDEYIAREVERGAAPVLTAGGRKWLDLAHQLTPGLLASPVRQHLLTRYRLEPLEAAGFVGERVLPR